MGSFSSCHRVDKDYAMDLNDLLRRAIDNDYPEFVRYISCMDYDDVNDKSLNVLQDDSEILFYAARKGYTDILECLSSHDGIDYSVRDNELLKSAAVNGHLETVKFLVSFKNVKPGIKAAICEAAHYDNSEVIEFLEQALIN